MTDAQTKTLGEAERIFARAAPEDTGRLKRDIHTHQTLHEATVTADPVDLQTGFRYIRITRFGHRVSVITPKRFKYLRFPYPKHTGKIVYAKKVRGYRPRTDWVARERPIVHKLARDNMKQVGKDFLDEAGG